MDNLNVTYTVILGGILNLVECRQVYIAKHAKPFDRLFDNTTEAAYATIESVIARCIRTDINVSAQIILDFAINYYGKLPPQATTLKRDYAAILSAITGDDKKYTVDLCNKLMQEKISMAAAMKLRAVINDPQQAGKLTGALTEYQEKASEATVNQGIKVYNMATDLHLLLKKVIRKPTGVQIIDNLLLGGIAAGEHIGILGSSSGGKTVITNQLNCNLALQGYKIINAQFEQAVEGDIAERRLTYLCKTVIDEVRDKPLAELSDEMKAKIDGVKHILDRMRDVSFMDAPEHLKNMGVKGIIKTFEDIINSGFDAKFILMDWLGAAATGFMRANGQVLSEYNAACMALMEDMNNWAKSKGISIIWLHQTSTEAQSRDPSYRPKKEDAFYFKSFCHKLEVCLQMGTLTRREDGTSILHLCIGKGRMSAIPKDHIIVRLNGKYMKMEETDIGEYIINSKGQFVSQAELLGIQETSVAGVYTPDKNTIDDFTSDYN